MAVKNDEYNLLFEVHFQSDKYFCIKNVEFNK